MKPPSTEQTMLKFVTARVGILVYNSIAHSSSFLRVVQYLLANSRIVFATSQREQRLDVRMIFDACY